MVSEHSIIPKERIERIILLLRGHKVMLDQDLAEMYGVETRALVQAVKRNRSRFPKDFMFQLNLTEFQVLRSQAVMSSGWGGRRHPPFAFTEQGVAMLSSVLTSERAIRVNVEIMRTFVRLRHLMESHAELGRRLAELDKKTELRFEAVFKAIRQILEVPAKRKLPIGFRNESSDS